ncbi:MAG: diaminopimelate epimerase [Lentisphaeria bacterium]|jgi:diaminopimelate epimerase
MTIAFWKMHGAGNDFIVVDDRDKMFPAVDRHWLQAVAHRNTGIGCDGFVLVQNSDTADFRMRFLNSDGGEVEMCGNGARCVARFAARCGITAAKMSFDTGAGTLHAEVLENDQVCLQMTDPFDWRLERSFEINERMQSYDFVNTGVPHVVIKVDDLDLDVLAYGTAIRHHPDFQPDGTNANFITCSGPQSLSLRTYERGVENETLACGTGVVAAALIAAQRGWVSPPVAVCCASGSKQTVDFNLNAEGARDVTLTGPAVFIFEGTVEYDG